MPELPEVEIARRNLERWTAGRRITRVEALDPTRVDGDASTLEGRTALRWERRGKMLIGRFGRLAFLSHLGMTGKWVVDPEDRPWQRFRLHAGDRCVALVDPRRFGRAWVIGEAEVAAHPRLAHLGPEPLDADFDAQTLRRRVGFGRSALKSRLLDQRAVAGLGNIAVIEACWRACVHPHLRCQDVPHSAWPRLHRAILDHLRQVLTQEDAPEIAYLGEVGAANPFHCYGRASAPCPRCATSIERLVLSGRSTFFCPTCQLI